MIGNINEDFFDQNSELSIIPECKKLIKTHGKEKASKIMWAIYLIEHPQSLFYRIPREDRIKEVQDNYYEIDLSKHEDIVEVFKTYSLSKEEALLKYFLDLLDKVVKKVEDAGLDNEKGIKIALDVLDKTPRIFDSLKNIQERLKKENEKIRVKGGSSQGARESRDRKGNQFKVNRSSEKNTQVIQKDSNE